MSGRRIRFMRIEACSICVFICALTAYSATNVYSLAYTPAPPDNPLKGFMPYAGEYSTFPYSMEWSYLPLRSLMSGPTNFNWSSLDTALTRVAERKHQTAFRIYLDYPALPTGIPQYLLDAGLVTHAYDDYDNDDLSLCPDYENPLLDQALTNFIAALGTRYDGDARIAFVELGLLGYWGEWHTYPETNWFASVSIQNAVLAAYTNAFHKTKLLVRGPAGTLGYSTLPIGYHDDSFAYETIDPPEYNFLGLLKAAGETNKWRTQPIGGEVRPEVQSCLWDTSQTNCVPAGQEFTNCVALTHASWLLNQGAFSPGFTGAEQDLALAGARQLGYELYVTNATLTVGPNPQPLMISVKILNTGAAPFYYNWPVQLGVLNLGNLLVRNWTINWKLSTLLPGTSVVWTCTQANPGLSAGQYTLLISVVNPMTNGLPLRFANETQDQNLAGWLTLGQFSIPPGSGQPTLSGTCVPPGFALHINTAATGTWRVEGSSNFLTWFSLFTTNTTSTRWNYTDDLLLPARFYRVVSQP